MNDAPSIDSGTIISAIELLMVLAIAVLAGLSITGGSQRRLQRRINEVAGAAPKDMPKQAGKSTIRRDEADSSIAFLNNLIKNSLPRFSVLRDKLSMTGKRITLGEYLLASLLTAGLAFVALNTLLHMSLAVSALLSIAAASFLPYKTIGIMVTRRQNQFLVLFPESIELIVRGLKSGVPTSESMRVVGHEIPDPVGAVFRDFTDAIALGRNLNDALAAASKRINVPEFRFFEICLAIQQETGGNLAETLEMLAGTLRRRKQIKLKIKALSSEARASAYILGVLPFLIFGFLFALNPAYVGVLLYDTRGHMVLGAALIFLALGVGTMIQMGRFEI